MKHFVQLGTIKLQYIGIATCVLLPTQIQRLPPLESSMIAFDTLTGNDSCLPLTAVLGGQSTLILALHSLVQDKLSNYSQLLHFFTSSQVKLMSL